MRKFLLLTLFSMRLYAGDAIVSWDYPTTYEDGSPLPMSEVLGVIVYYGTTPGGPYTSNKLVAPPATTVTITNLSPGTWYFVATVMASNNLESSYSNEVIKSVASTSKPKKPTVR